ncbi:flavin-containing oxidoreductase [Burkholderia pseudomallei]|nr:flavin-containing oxidoreductase [Burkholderia pseudomallei]QBP73369.1 flavin-containing oxidoreductase [Burkholderia pseudomallei]QBR28890.1 flavin-containing oxidoreductase [Burkholderia pseudomallei]
MRRASCVVRRASCIVWHRCATFVHHYGVLPFLFVRVK